MIWDLLFDIILLISCILFIILLIKRRNAPKEKNKNYLIYIIIILILTLIFGIVLNSIKTNTYKTHKYDTIEQLVKQTTPSYIIEDILYYENYAIVFLYNEHEKKMKWYSTSRDDEGWNNFYLNNERTIVNFYGKECTIFELDENTGLDCIIFYSLEKGNIEEGLENRICDTYNSKFRRLELTSGYDLCYAFADVDDPGYQVNIDGKDLIINDIDFSYSLYNYEFYNKE